MLRCISGRKTLIPAVAGSILIVIGALGMAHGVRAAVAQTVYLSVKYGGWGRDARGAARRCATAHGFYPYNYYFCLWTAGRLCEERLDCLGRESADRIELAEYWCDAGLRLNPYNRQLKWLKTRLLDRHSADEAIEYWREYVDWDFWRPANHALLFDLYMRSGKLVNAMETIEWFKDSRYYDRRAEQLAQAWEREMASP